MLDTRTGDDRSLYITAIVIYVICAGVTLWMTGDMGRGMMMPGGWSMSMVWMRMPGQTVAAAALMFAAMWATMMVAMMLPSTWPMLRLYQRLVIFRGERHAAVLPWAMAASYFATWTVFGLTAYAIGIRVASAAMMSSAVSRTIPTLGGAALIAAGLYQFTPWKAACLRHCRTPVQFLTDHLTPGWQGAVRVGVHHGAYCVACCWGLMVMQLVMGVMSVPAMILIGLVIATEKLISRPRLVVSVVGGASSLAGVAVIARMLLSGSG